MTAVIRLAASHWIVGAALAVAGVAACAAPASEQSVEALLEVTKTQAMVESVYASVEQMMRQGMNQAVQGQPISAEQQRVFDELPRRFVAVIREEYNWPKMKPLYVLLYRETFEQEEIDGLLAFYRSPTGQAFVAKMPVVLQKSMVLAQSQLHGLAPKMKAAIEQALADAKIAR